MYIKIQGEPEDLHFLSEHLQSKEIEIEPIFQREKGVTKEPLLIALIIALGGEKIIETITDLIKHSQNLKSQEKIELEKMKYQFLNDVYKVSKNISFDELLKKLEEFKEMKK